MERRMRVGREKFEPDPAQRKEDDRRYDEGRGLIGGDPSRRPAHVRWRSIPEHQPYFRLIDISDDKQKWLDAFLHDLQHPLEIEIGFGSGDFLLGRAGARPGGHFLGFEVKRHLCRSLVKAAEQQKMTNLWVSDDDARWALPQLDLAGRVDVIHILYPDPWWKRKHHAKRLFRLPFVELVYELLAPEGLLHVRSDVEGYVDLIEQVVERHGGFEPNDPTLAAPFDDDSSSQREDFCRTIGRPFWVLAFRSR